VPAGFKTNALEELARQLGVRGFSTIANASGGSLTGPAKREALYRMIVSQITGTGSGREAGPAAQGGAAAAAGPAAGGIREELARRQISSAGALTSLRVDQLRVLAKSFGLASSGKKGELINRIAAQAGFDALPTQEDVQRQLDQIIQMATQ
jgi:hypothetical protein